MRRWLAGLLSLVLAGGAVLGLEATVAVAEPGATSVGVTIAAGLNSPRGVAVDGSGNVYVADTQRSLVLKCGVDFAPCVTVAGSWNESSHEVWDCVWEEEVTKLICDWVTVYDSVDFSGSGPNQLSSPSGVAVDSTGNVYVADTNNNRVQKCAPGTITCSTVAGGNGPGLASNQFSSPQGVAIDADGNVYVADTNNNRVQKCIPFSVCTTVGGGIGLGSSSAALSWPRGLTLDAPTHFLVADTGNNRVQRCGLSSLVCETIAGGSSGSGADQLSSPSAVALDVVRNLYVADSSNRRVQKCVSGSLICSTVAGQGVPGQGLAQVAIPSGVAIDSVGNYYFSDEATGVVRKCVGASTSCVAADQVISFAPLGNQDGRGGRRVRLPALAATASSGLQVVYASQTPEICDVYFGQLVFGERAGTCTILASQPGNTQFTAAIDVIQSFEVTMPTISQTILFDELANKNRSSPPFALAAVATSGLDVSYSSNTPSTCSVTGNIVTVARVIGTCSLTAIQEGDSTYIAAANVVRSFEVIMPTIGQAILFDELPNKKRSSPPFALAAVATSGLDVSYGSNTPSTCSVTGNIVTVARVVGTCSLTATQEGDSTYIDAIDVVRSFTVEVGLISLRIADSGANEGSGPAGTTVSTMFGIDHPTSEALCVWYSTEDATAAGADRITAWDGTQDFTRLGITKPKYVILGANKSSGKISTKINYDTTAEADEYFNVVVSKVTTKVSGKCDPTSGADPRFVLVRDTGKVTIHDDDTKSSQTAFRVADSGATEGSGPVGTTVSVMFGTDRPTAAPLCVWYSTVGVTATGADKITAWNGTQDFTRLGVLTPKYVILGTNRTSGKISTKINYDTTIEEDEYFNIVVSKVTPQVGGRCTSTSLADPGVVLTRDTGRVTIFDDDTPQG